MRYSIILNETEKELGVDLRNSYRTMNKSDYIFLIYKANNEYDYVSFDCTDFEELRDEWLGFCFRCNINPFCITSIVIPEDVLSEEIFKAMTLDELVDYINAYYPYTEYLSIKELCSRANLLDEFEKDGEYDIDVRFKVANTLGVEIK